MDRAGWSGPEPGARRLNGPQTTGRDYRDLSEPEYRVIAERDVAATMRDGGRLLADVYRPESPARFPALVAASCYPRQIQDLGAPSGFIEAGATDFFVPRGYVHVIANVRGTGQSDGSFGLFDAQERRDLHDLVEWAAAQPWCDGRVGMVGISYFAAAQVGAAVEHPPHLRAIFPVALSADLYGVTRHHGLLNADFISAWIFAVGLAAHHDAGLWRGTLFDLARRVLAVPSVHARVGQANGEGALATLRSALRGRYDAEPWDRLWERAAVEHPLRDAFWDERSVLPALGSITVPTYLGCDWDNVPMHLPGTFEAWRAMRGRPDVRMGLLPPRGLSWPWESLHVEALAWFDHWLKDRDTGVTDGPPIRYWLTGAEGWRTADDWPPPESTLAPWRLDPHGVLTPADGPAPEDASGSRAEGRSFLRLTGTTRRPPHVHPPTLPSWLSWDSARLGRHLDVVGDLELQLVATVTDLDAAWIVVLQDVAPDGTAVDVTAGHLRAALRAVDEAASTPGAPVLPCRTAEAVPPGEPVGYRIPLVPVAHRFRAGHRLRLVVAGDDEDPAVPAPLGMRHAGVGGSVTQTVHPVSTLLLPVLEG